MRSCGWQVAGADTGPLSVPRSCIATCSSGGSSAPEARHSQDSRLSDAMTSSNSVTSDPGKDVITAHFGQRLSFLRRWSNPSATSMSPARASPDSSRSQPTLQTSPRSWHSDSSPRVYPFTSAALQSEEYVSFLDL